MSPVKNEPELMLSSQKLTLMSKWKESTMANFCSWVSIWQQVFTENTIATFLTVACG